MSTARALTTDFGSIATGATAARRRWPVAVVALLLALSVCLPLLDDLGTHHHTRGGLEVTHDHFHLGPHGHGWAAAPAATGPAPAPSPSHRAGDAGFTDESPETPTHDADAADRGHSHGGEVHRHGPSGPAHSHDHGDPVRGPFHSHGPDAATSAAPGPAQREPEPATAWSRDEHRSAAGREPATRRGGPAEEPAPAGDGYRDEPQWLAEPPTAFSWSAPAMPGASAPSAQPRVSRADAPARPPARGPPSRPLPSGAP